MQYWSHYKYAILVTPQIGNTGHTTNMQYWSHYKYAILVILQICNNGHTTNMQYWTHYKYAILVTLHTILFDKLYDHYIRQNAQYVPNQKLLLLSGHMDWEVL